jgi:predicted nuclease with TOPRIM domain
MENEIKFTEEELQSIKSLQDESTQIIMEFGQIELALLNNANQLKALESEKSRLQERYQSLTSQEQQLVQELNTKYGSGTVDIESGVFIPNK